MNPPTTSIEDLPPEMISELFEYLPPKDLVACSLVNKRWHSIYSNFKLHRLVSTSYPFFRWFDSNRPIRETERCRPSMFIRLIEKPLLSNLKHLALVGSLELDLNKLNRFQQLLQLEIYCIPYNQTELQLNLPRLKVLAFHEFNKRCSLSIDCPLLNTLLYPGELKDTSRLEVKHPETIRKLEMYMELAKRNPFKNVECLVTWEYRSISKDTLLTLPKLRELRYNQVMGNVFVEESRRGLGTLDRVKRTLNEFLNEAKKLRGTDFRFTFAGLQVTNLNVDQIDFRVQIDEETGRESVCNEYFYLKNYHLIEPGALHFVDFADYKLLLSNVTGEFPRCFSQKFTNINWVYTADGVQDPEHFLWFLKSLRSLRKLELEETGLRQEFYDQLPASTPLLSILYLFNGHCEAGLQLNFDFIYGLTCLWELMIEPALSLESLPSLVRSLGRLEEAQFYVRSGEEQFDVRKKNLTKWTIRRFGELLFETENPEEIVDFFEEPQD